MGLIIYKGLHLVYEKKGNGTILKQNRQRKQLMNNGVIGYEIYE